MFHLLTRALLLSEHRQVAEYLRCNNNMFTATFASANCFIVKKEVDWGHVWQKVHNHIMWRNLIMKKNIFCISLICVGATAVKEDPGGVAGRLWAAGGEIADPILSPQNRPPRPARGDRGGCPGEGQGIPKDISRGLPMLAWGLSGWINHPMSGDPG